MIKCQIKHSCKSKGIQPKTLLRSMNFSLERTFALNEALFPARKGENWPPPYGLLELLNAIFFFIQFR